MKKILVILTLFCTSISFCSIFGGGGSGVDLSEIIKLMTKMEGYQFQIKEDSLEQLQATLKNLESLNGALTNGQLVQLQQGWQKIMDIQNTVTSAISDYNNFEEQFQNVYTDFKDLKNLTPAEYLQKSKDLMNNTKKIYTDAMKMVGISSPDKIGSDAAKVQAVMSAANSAEGQKQVLQASTQLAAHQISILGELRTLVGQSLNAQSAYLNKLVEEEATKTAIEEDFFRKNEKDLSNKRIKDLDSGFKVD